jgi:erythromycin esterase
VSKLMTDAISMSTEERIRQVSHPLNTQDDLDPLLDFIGDARFVLLGEASHGTSEYYVWRTRLSQRLIQEKSFSFIAVEGDWPDCYRVNRYVKGYDGAGNSAYDVLNTYERWPTWMWANWEVVALIEWLRRYNADQPEDEKIGFYGLDVYSLWESLTEVTKYLEQSAPDAVQAAYTAYSCFQPYDQDEQAYAYATHLVPTSCEDEVIRLLMETQRKAQEVRYDGDAEASFNAEQNAFVAVGAERYYRTMIRGDSESWNIRDRHMVDTLQRLVQHHGSTTKAIVWEHNTHVGDARATPMARQGMVNVGQLTRDRLGDEGVVLVGFGSYQGSVIAGRSWGGPMEVMPVSEAREESWEGVLHQSLAADSLLILADDDATKKLFQDVRGHRAIGVVYNPYEWRGGSFVPSSLSDRYDAFIYLEHTEALHPLHLEPVSNQPPETYPWGV